MNNGWNYLKDSTPESGQEVLTYWYEEDYETEQIHILTYFVKGATIEDPSIEITLTGRGTAIIAMEDGFYFCENGEWRKHADLITHWQPLPGAPLNPVYSE